MPQISAFFGVEIFMFFQDHSPPHFHAKYSEYEVLVDIRESVVIKGVIPARQLKLILAWCELHQEELLKNWEKCRNHEAPMQIEGLK